MGAFWGAVRPLGGGGGSTPPAEFSFQGTNYAYSAGGYTTTYVVTIDRYAIPPSANAADVGDLASATGALDNSAQQSAETGYTCKSQTIEKWSFASGTQNASAIGLCTASRTFVAGASSGTHGYNFGGDSSNIIEKFTVASDNDATDVGDLTQARRTYGGNTDTVNGYGNCTGGNTTARVNTIDRFPFASDSNAADVGDLSAARMENANQSSTTNGFVCGGDNSASNVLDNYAFSASSNASDVGDLAPPTQRAAGQSGESSGFISGGSGPLSTIQSFAYASGSASDTTYDLSQARFVTAGCQF